MPTYKYECSSCKNQEDHDMSMAEVGSIEILCSKCGSTTPMEKKWYAPAVHMPRAVHNH